MNTETNPTNPSDFSHLSGAELLVAIRADQTRRWHHGDRIRADVYLDRIPALRNDTVAVLALYQHDEILQIAFGVHDHSETPSKIINSGISTLIPKPVDENADTVVGSESRAESDSLPTVPGYEVLRLLGRGGMGAVYLAHEQKLNRPVALKMLLPGSAGDDDVRRFTEEARVVARLQHPNVVQVFDYGVHDGQPYFAMEFVPGGGLDRTLQGEPQPPTRAAELVETLARAVHVAHQAGVVHRDLKPANVLMSDDIPKVSDFGLAKQLEAESGLTVSGQILGTPSYMSPEQANGETSAVGPASDVWALGAILYEMLTGRPPFKGATKWETIRMVGERDPVPVRRLTPEVPRDLETICLKCLQKEPSRRYPDALNLAEDLRRFLDGRAVQARPIGPVGQLTRWARRKPALAGVTGTVLLLTLTLILGGIWTNTRLRGTNEQLRDAIAESEQRALAEAQQRQRADREATQARENERLANLSASQARQVRDLLTRVFTAVDPLGLDTVSFGAARGNPPPNTRELVARAEAALADGHITDPLVRAEVCATLGDLYRSLGELKRAEPLLDEAVSLRRRHLPEENLAVAESLHHLGWLRHEQGRLDEAKELYEQALSLRERLLPDDDPRVTDSRFHLAWLLTLYDDLPRAEELFLGVIEERSERGGTNDRDASIARLGLVAVYLEASQPEKAMLSLPAVLTYLRENVEGSRIERGVARFQEAVILQQKGLYEKSIEPLLEAKKLIGEQLGDDHLYMTIVLFQLGLGYEGANQLDEAERAYRACLELGKERVGMHHPKTTALVEEYALLLDRLGRTEEAEALFDELLAAQKGRCGDRFYADALLAHGKYLRETDRPEEALEAFREALPIYERTGGPKRRLYTNCLNELGLMMGRLGDLAAAERFHLQNLNPTRTQYGERHKNVGVVLANLAGTRLDQGRTDQIREPLQEALPMLRGSVFPPKAPSPVLAEALTRIVEYHVRVGESSEAIRYASELARTWPRDPVRLYQAARCYAQIAGTQGLSDDERDEYVEMALKQLRAAIDHGFRNRSWFREDADLWEPARSRAEFDEMTRRMSGSRQPK